MSPSIEFEIKVPEAGESVQEAMIESWLVDDGAMVVQDDPVVELETDKASMELVTEQAGQLKILIPAGQMVKVGDVIGTVHAKAASKSSDAHKATAKDTQAAPKAEEAKEQSSSTEQSPADKVQPQTGPASTDSQTKTQASTTAAAATAASVAPGKLITTSSPHGPATQVMAAQHNITLAPPAAGQGRTTTQDISVHQQPAKASPSSAGEPGLRQADKKPLSLMRKRIAERLLSATQTSAMLTTFNEVDMTEIIAIRSSFKDTFLATHNIKLGFMGFFIQASAQALKEFPHIGAYLDDDHIITHHYADIGVAVSTEKGLVVPVIQNAEAMDLHALELKLAELATKARNKSLKIHEMQGGTFTITNGGVFGSLLSTPILNPPQSAILGLHKIEQRPRVMADQSIQARPMMYLALSYDHRIVDGKEAVGFLARIKELLEAPMRLWLKI